jgi:hypothetical protein
MINEARDVIMVWIVSLALLASVIAGIMGYVSSSPDPDIDLELQHRIITERIEMLKAKGINNDELRYLLKQK